MSLIKSAISSRKPSLIHSSCITQNENFEAIVRSWDILGLYQSGKGIIGSGQVDTWEPEVGAVDITAVVAGTEGTDPKGRICPASAGASHMLAIYSATVAVRPWFRSIVYKSDITGGTYYIVTAAPNTGRRVIFQTNSGGNLTMSMVSAQISTTAMDTNWHHVVIYAPSAGNEEMYLDGTLIKSGDAGTENISAVRLFAHHTGIVGWQGAVADICDVQNAANFHSEKLPALLGYVKSRYGIG